MTDVTVESLLVSGAVAEYYILHPTTSSVRYCSLATDLSGQIRCGN